MNNKQYSFQEMTKKTVVNVADGRELGNVCDMVFNGCGGVLGFVVPGKKSFFKSLTSQDCIFIPWNRIIKIGGDVILVELVQGTTYTMSTHQNEQSQPIYSPQAQEYEQNFAQSQPYQQTVYHSPDENK